MAIKRRLTLLVLLSQLLFLTGCVFYSTQPNEVGVRTTKLGLFGKAGVESEIYAPGSTYLFLPVIYDWHTFNTNLQNMEMTAQLAKGDIYGQDDLKFKTIDGNDIGLDLIISYRIIPEKAPYIVAHVARSDMELRTKIVRVVARSLPRDIFGELQTEAFYKSELRAEKSVKAKALLNEILNPYGVIVEKVLTKDYRFNREYQQAIEDKKIADQQTEKLRSEVLAKQEEYKRKLERAKGEVFKDIAKADGDYEQAKIAADAYYIQQQNIAKAIQREGKAEAQGIQKMNEALAEQGGKIMVKLEMAKALKDKKIILLPSASGNSIDLKTLDVNKFLEVEGLRAKSQTTAD
ncbi:prohibitin family protein [bacterium]|nr:prohibitin family protein [bacterium]